MGFYDGRFFSTFPNLNGSRLSGMVDKRQLAPKLVCMTYTVDDAYRKTSSISGTKSQNWNVSRLVLQLFLSNPLKPGVKSRMKM